MDVLLINTVREDAFEPMPIDQNTREGVLPYYILVDPQHRLLELGNLRVRAPPCGS
jgi:hypothetical protein